MLRRLAAAWRFLTVIPCPWWADDNEAEALRGSVLYFPAVGLVLGLLSCAVVAALTPLFPAGVTAALVVVLLAGWSGGLHLDGLADSADALLSPGHSREKALAVMKDSRIGSHGAVALIMVLLVKYACLASFEAWELPWVVLAVPVAGRAAMLFPMAYLPYAREKGLGSLFTIPGQVKTAGAACVWTAVLLLAALGVSRALAGFLLWLAMAFLWVWFLRKRLGGATGDTYGAACEFGEMMACFAAALSGKVFL